MRPLEVVPVVTWACATPENARSNGRSSLVTLVSPSRLQLEIACRLERPEQAELLIALYVAERATSSVRLLGATLPAVLFPDAGNLNTPD